MHSSMSKISRTAVTAETQAGEHVTSLEWGTISVVILVRQFLVHDLRFLEGFFIYDWFMQSVIDIVFVLNLPDVDGIPDNF